MVFLKQQTLHSMAPMARNWLAIETTTELEVPGGSTSRSFRKWDWGIPSGKHTKNY